MLKMIEATIDDLNRIEQLYKDCTLNLNERGIYQWDDRYPSISRVVINPILNVNEYHNSLKKRCVLLKIRVFHIAFSTYISSIGNKCQYIFEDDNTLIGSVILNENQSAEWDSIPWNYIEGKILIIHALAIGPSLQGKGYGQKVLELCEAQGINTGYTAIRLDVFSENQAAIRLYEKNGYQKVGEVMFRFKPEGHQKYYCYEKMLIWQ